MWSDGVKRHPADGDKDFAVRIGTRPRGAGFWKGLVAGILVSAVVALLLAYLFPPTRYLAPDVPAGGGAAPDVPGAPSAIVRPRAPGAGGVLPDPARAPLIATRPAAEPSPFAPAAAPDFFRDAPSGSPSLVPR